jgi:Archaeal flagella assembly protein J
MFSLFSAGLSPEEVVFALSKDGFFSPYSKYFSKVSNLIKGYRFKFSTAISKTIKSIKSRYFKEFVFGFSQAVTYGDNMESYFSREIEVALNEYNSAMFRKIESLNNFLSIYITLNSSLVFLLSSITILALLYESGEYLVNLMLLLALTVITNMTLALYFIYKPESYINYKLMDKLLFLAVISVILVFSVLGNYFLIAILGAMAFVIGLWFKLKEDRIWNLERNYVLFVRYFCRTYTIVGNIYESFSTVLRGDLGRSKELIKNAQVRLNYGVSKRKIFNLISEESKSILVGMVNKILISSIEVGGKMGDVGDILGKIGDTILNLRLRRDQNGRAFESSVYALQTSVSAIASSLIYIVSFLSQLFSLPFTGNIFQFTPLDLNTLQVYFSLILVSLSISNGIGIAIAYGRSLNYSLYFIGILTMISSIAFHIVFILVQGLFSSLNIPSNVGLS